MEFLSRDLDSTNGTYVDGQQIQKTCMVEFRQQITLEGKRAKEKVCALEFLLNIEGLLQQ